ncbi:MAG: amidohydrolase family protein [Burkholderiaceae bacterium]
MIDTHVHLFDTALPRVAGARHDPRYDATLAQLQGVAAPAGVHHFVVVQPSFLGTDNSHLLDVLRANPRQLRGIVVADPLASDAQLAAWGRNGVVGIRLNLLRTDLARTLDDRQLALVQRCAALGLSLEIHDDIARLPAILDAIGEIAGSVIIDHFGRPESIGGDIDDPRYRSLLARLRRSGHYVKLSAPYRSRGMDARAAIARLCDELDVSRLLWGSDWPWTQHEQGRDYVGWAALFDGFPGLAQRMADNAGRLFRFSGDAQAHARSGNTF